MFSFFKVKLFGTSTIVARFIGDDSCGFEHGHTYHLRNYTEPRHRIIWAKDMKSHACCPYSSINALAKNWEIPVRDWSIPEDLKEVYAHESDNLL